MLCQALQRGCDGRGDDGAEEHAARTPPPGTELSAMPDLLRLLLALVCLGEEAQVLQGTACEVASGWRQT